MSVTGIVAALTAEARTLGRMQSGSINTLPDGTLVAISGMGAAAATLASLSLVAAGAQGLLSFGVAGALDPRLVAGAMLLPEAVTDEAGARHATDDAWRARLAALAARRPDRQRAGGTLLSVARPLTLPAAKSRLWTHTGACAVDMESFAIASVALKSGIRFAVARVVLDTAADQLPGSVMRATGARGEMAYPQLVAGLLRRPGEVFALLKLARRYRAAMDSLRYLAEQGPGLS